MPERRKTKDELRQEAFADVDGPPPDFPIDQDGSAEPTGEQTQNYEAFSEADWRAVNNLFRTINEAGYGTLGSYQLARDGPDQPMVVTVSAVIPPDGGNSHNG